VSQHVFQSNKVARDLCAQFGLQQCVVLGFSDARGYEIVAAGDNEEDARLSTEVALGLKDALTVTNIQVRLVV